MPKPKLHKRHILSALLLASVLVLPARAFTFTDDLFSIDIPEGEKTYYYTQRGTNMTGTMLENAQKQDMLLLIGSYNEAGTLQYTFKVESRTGSSSLDLAQLLRVELAGSYQLDEPVAGTVAGTAGQILNGRSVQNSNYAVRVYVTDGVPNMILTTMYQPTEETQVMQLLSSLAWTGVNAPWAPVDDELQRDPDAVPMPGESPAVPEPDPDPTPTPAVLPQPQPLEQESPTADRWQALAVFLDAHFPLVFATGGVIMAALLVGIFLLLQEGKNTPKRARGKRPAKKRPRRGRSKGYVPKHGGGRPAA